ncbi:NLR family CARD domain-containing protein 3-like [Pimephales promelas]|nr:NLR family CARD domain-containing protein 3-like [Pimephales promelas]
MSEERGKDSLSQMSLSEKHSVRSGSHVSSSVSLKSDRSKDGELPNFSEKTPSSNKSVRSGSHVSSSVSLKSDCSKGGVPPDFSEKTPSSNKRFPGRVQDADIRQKWVKNINRQEWVPNNNSRVCGIHFPDGRPTKEHPYPVLHMGYETHAGPLPSGRAPPKRRCLEPLTVNTMQVTRIAAEPADVEVDVDNLENIPLQKCDVGVQWPEISEHNYCSSKSTKDSATQTDPAPSISAYDFDDKDTPNGFVMFVSKLFGGRASDTFITRNSGLISHLLPGDQVLADRGFTITDVLPPGVTLAIPAFTRGCKELPEHEVTQTRRLANLIREETEGEASEIDEDEHIDEQEEGDEYSWDMAEDIEETHLF